MLLITQLTIIEIANEIDCIAQKCPKKEKTRLIALVGAVSSLSLHRNCDEKVDAINGTRYTKDKLRAACIQPAKYREMG